MKKCMVSRSRLRIYLVGMLFLYSGLPMLWYFSGKTLSKDLDMVIICVAGTLLMLFLIIGFSGGTFYIGEEGVGMRLFLVKKRIIPWSEIKECGVFPANGIYIVYFASKHLSSEKMNRFLDSSRFRDIDWLAFAEFDTHFLERTYPFMPPKFAAIMRERARQVGLDG